MAGWVQALPTQAWGPTGTFSNQRNKIKIRKIALYNSCKITILLEMRELEFEEANPTRLSPVSLIPGVSCRLEGRPD